MYRIDNATAITPIPTPGAVGPNPDCFFTNGDPNNAIAATIVDADWANSLQEEVCNVITDAGTTLSKTVRTQLRDAIKLSAQAGSARYAASTTAANTYTATLAPVPAAYTTGMVVFIKFTNANTGAATLNLNSLGAKSITHLDGTALVAGDIAAGMIGIFSYDGTNLQLLNPSSVTLSGVQTGSYTYAASTTAANTYTATLSPAITAYTTGMTVRIKFSNANTGAATINLNSLGAISIVTTSGVALIANDIVAGEVVILAYDGTNFQLLTKPASQQLVHASTAGHANVTGDSTTYTCIFETASTNVGTCYNTSTGLFTAPKTGLYAFTLCIHITGLAAGNTLMNTLFHGGTQPYLFYRNHITGEEAGAGWLMSGTVIMALNVNDTMDIRLQVSGATKVVGLGSSALFDICLIG